MKTIFAFKILGGDFMVQDHDSSNGVGEPKHKLCHFAETTSEKPWVVGNWNKEFSVVDGHCGQFLRVTVTDDQTKVIEIITLHSH